MDQNRTASSVTLLFRTEVLCMHAADLAAQHFAVKKMCPTLSPALVDRAVGAVNVDFSCFGLHMLLDWTTFLLREL